MDKVDPGAKAESRFDDDALPKRGRLRGRRWGALLLLSVGCSLASERKVDDHHSDASTAPEQGSAATEVPESEVNVVGIPRFGRAPDGTVRGFLDAHTHMMSNVAFGGSIVCGETFHEQGAAAALQDCSNHHPGGHGALIENLTHRGEKQPFDGHDPHGWPTFHDWPHADSMTHQQMYYKWVERSWRAGQRIMVQHMVNNNVLCSLPTQVNKHSCEDMYNVRLQIAETRRLEKFIDDQHGGKGQGWFRIVDSPKQAREVIEQGKLAVVMGVEVSAPFGCSYNIHTGANCDQDDIRRGFDELYDLGIRTMFLCHKFNNALCGVRFDVGTQGNIVNAGNFLNTGGWWQTETCKTQVTDNTVSSILFDENFKKLFPQIKNVPAYDKGPHCNQRGLTDLGEFALREMMQRGMIVEIDHMSVKAADRTLSILEKEKYRGVISSHSWMAPAYHERVYKLGGMIAQYGHNAGQFVDEMKASQAMRKKYDAGYAFGMDMNGFGGTPQKPKHGEPEIQYPFSADAGITVDRQVTGKRVWDYNKDGVAHYGMIPDWVEHLRQIGGDEIIDELAMSSEKYLQMWADIKIKKKPNLALWGKASAKSVEGIIDKPEFAAQKAIDGDQSTRWSSEWSRDQWWQLDLGAPKSFSQVTIDWEWAAAREYRIEISNDGSTWKKVAYVSKSAHARRDVVELGAQSARYIRWVGVRRLSGFGYSFFEFALR